MNYNCIQIDNMSTNQNTNLLNLKNHLKEFGKTDSWVNLAKEFNVFQDRSNKAQSDGVRAIYRKISRNIKQNIIIKETPLKLKSKWFNGSEWCESYKADDSADIVNTLQDFKQALLSDLKSLSTQSYRTFKNKPSNGVLYELALPDFHFGKIDGLSLTEQSELFINTVLDLVSRAEGLNIEKFLLPIGNDFFNTDNLNYTTTKGTQQVDNAHWHASFRVGWTTIIKVITFLKEVAPVDIVIVQGNHDYTKTVYLGEVLEAYYSNERLVTIYNDINTPRKYYAWNEVLIGYTHGDKEKLSDLPLLMATEVPELWAKAKHRSFHTGHLHKEQVSQIQGVTIRILPSLTGQDEWHKQMGYNSVRKAQALIWSKDGLDGYLQKTY